MKRFFAIASALLIAALAVVSLYQTADTEYVLTDTAAQVGTESLGTLKANYINRLSFMIEVDGDESTLLSEDIYLTSDGSWLFSRDAVSEAFGCAVNVYDESTIILVKGSASATIKIGSETAWVSSGTVEMSVSPIYMNGILYIPEDALTKALGFEGEIYSELCSASYSSGNEELTTLPSSYSSEDYGRMPSVKNQGNFGSCWAFAALSAIEAALLPETEAVLSADHMIYNNGFGTDAESGGDQIMSMSYLVSWKGPVYESDDPYGDSETDSSLEAIFHVQEIQYLPSGDFDAIKEAVIKYGAVETSLYIATVNGLYVDYSYYNYTRAAYCCSESGKTVNHEVIIIGWDDDFPAEYFEGNVTTDGAFICLNSWGEGFGSDGIFYVSYEDAYIGVSAIAYTRVESADNYDNIYQYDDVGWTANIGYAKNKAYMANVFTADSAQTLMAVGFYAVGADTSYEVYVITDYEDEASLRVDGECLAAGTLENAGYYTIDLAEGIDLEDGQKYAVIVMVDTTGEGKPIACEMSTDTVRTSTITTQGKYSYISAYGTSWESTQSEFGANVCLKAYTDER